MYAQLAILGVAVAVAFASGWKVNGWRHDADYLARMDGARIALESTARELAKLEVTHTTIRQEVQNNVIEKPVYRDCRHDADTVRLLNYALTGRQSADSGELPGTDGVVRRLLWGDHDEVGGGSKPVP